LWKRDTFFKNIHLKNSLSVVLIFRNSVSFQTFLFYYLFKNWINFFDQYFRILKLYEFFCIFYRKNKILWDGKRIIENNLILNFMQFIFCKIYKITITSTNVWSVVDYTKKITKRKVYRCYLCLGFKFQEWVNKLNDYDYDIWQIYKPSPWS
jgi:hypothetical protein